jgi:hypothetical protein
MTPAIHPPEENEVAQAQWRVRSVLQRLDSHRSLQLRDEQWQEREADYLERLRHAHEELDRVRRSADPKERARAS